MTQPDLFQPYRPPNGVVSLDDVLSKKVTLCDQLAAYFRQHEGEWVDGRDLSRVGGYAAYRTRISELRHAPYFMQIKNRTRRATVLDKGGVYAISESRPFTISEYRFTREG